MLIQCLLSITIWSWQPNIGVVCSMMSSVIVQKISFFILPDPITSLFKNGIMMSIIFISCSLLTLTLVLRNSSMRIRVPVHVYWRRSFLKFVKSFLESELLFDQYRRCHHRHHQSLYRKSRWEEWCQEKGISLESIQTRSKRFSLPKHLVVSVFCIIIC